MIIRKISLLITFGIFCNFCFAQNVPILNLSENALGQVQLEIEASADKYYVLTALHAPDMTYESVTSITLGVDGNMFISEPLGAYEIQNYKITAYDIDDPADIDGDGIDDMTEFNDMPSKAPINFANEIPFEDGTTSVDNADTYSELGVIDSDIPWAPFLNNKEFVKFAILNQASDSPEVYFINSKTHYIHANFLATIDTDNANITTGEIVYNPNEILPNGTVGSYSFNYSFGAAKSFEATQITFELLCANMPYLKNNMVHFIGGGGESTYKDLHEDDFEGSRIEVVLESDLFADVDFLPFHQAEGFGFFRVMTLNENPGSRDIVIYDALPNSLPRVGGIITSVVQTPLSHVNLRAIQDNVPNAYIKDPLSIDSIANLIGKYIYYKVESDNYQIREASQEEVNAWYENIRPTEPQIPVRNLSQTKILPLDEIEFDMADAFGAKCSNVATMRRFGFPDGTIPDGFGIPFYFYDEFMKFNGFYDQVTEMITQPDFIADFEVRIDRLKDFRKEIKDADMPQWMLDELQEMHDSFPEGTSVRCRSSTNNEDLPGFSGAGLYTSKTQHPEEGHISKSVKQVYASIWNFRAFEERDFYRVDQYIAAMGLLCHPNYSDEKSNGVGVSIDPIYATNNTFYLNTQVGESLITNPDANSIPEEILLNEEPSEGYFVLRNSNLVPDGELVMNENYLALMRDYLRVIHDEFEVLYNVSGAEGFGMDIEYKVTVDDRLIIKQARPWVSFWAGIKANFDLAAEEIIEPKSSSSLGEEELVTVKVANKGLSNMKDFDISLYINNEHVETLTINNEIEPFRDSEFQLTVPQDFSAIGEYHIMTIVSHQEDGYVNNDTLRTTIQKLHFLEGSLVADLHDVGCGTDVTLSALVENFGETTFTNTEIEVTVNGLVVDTFIYDFGIPYGTAVEILVPVINNLQDVDNQIQLKLLRVNGEQDAIEDNNQGTVETDLSVDKDIVSFIITPDNFPQETTWQVIEENTNEIIAGGALNGDGTQTEEICLNYNSCFTLYVYDSYGDGICCSFGDGDFYILDADGETVVYSDGDFGSEFQMTFCPGECFLMGTVTTTKASEESQSDGTITINAEGGVEPYEYSIDGGENFESTNVFTGLAPGTYMIVVKEADGNCLYEETVELEFDVIISVDERDILVLDIYPNPTSGLLTITSSDTSIEVDNIKILNALGQEMSINKTHFTSENSINISHLDEGIYYLSLSTEKSKKTVIKRIVKVY